MRAFRFASLGSGSRGNATLVEAGNTRVLVDSGFGVRDTLRRLDRLEVEAGTLDAIFVTHEHSDHATGVAALARRLGIPVFLTAGTRAAMEARGLFDGLAVDCRRVVRGVSMRLGALTVEPVRVPHDAAEPCQYVFACDGARLGILTDLGSLTPRVVEAYGNCDALLLECNHEARLLAEGPYPPALKARVGGDFGHLSNAQAALLLQRVDRARLRTLVLGHLSEKNNLAPLAQDAVAAALGREREEIPVATQAGGCGWMTVANNEARAAGECGA